MENTNYKTYINYINYFEIYSKFILLFLWISYCTVKHILQTKIQCITTTLSMLFNLLVLNLN